jgi:uncharacterized alpha-E superfamily protein
MMLARTAEYLFWAGRYLERAESTARHLDVTYHRLLEVTPAEEAEAWQDVLVAVGLLDAYSATGYPFSAAPVSEFLVTGPNNRGSIVASVAQARDNARGVREHLAMELWEALNTLHLHLASRDVAYDLAMQPFELYTAVRSGIQGVIGCATETWSREDAWRFFMLGLLLERAEMCVRTLRVRHPRHQADAMHEWSATLRSASALQAYRRQYRSFDAAALVELLLLSPTLPRSVLFSLRAAEDILGDLGRGADGERSVGLRLLGRVRAELEFADAAELCAGDLEEVLSVVESQIRDVASAVAAERFSYRVELDLHALALLPGEPVIPGSEPASPAVAP